MLFEVFTLFSNQGYLISIIVHLKFIIIQGDPQMSILIEFLLICTNS